MIYKIYNAEHLPILASTVTGYVSISAFVSLVGISIGIASSAAIKNIWVIKEYDETKEEIKNSNNQYVWYNQTNTICFVSA